MMPSNSLSVKLSGDVKSVKGVHKYGRFAVREISADEQGFCSVAGNSVIGRYGNTLCQDSWLKSRDEGKSPERCFVAVEEMCLQTDGPASLVVHRTAEERRTLSPMLGGGVFSSVHSNPTLSLEKSEMDRKVESNSNSLSRPVEVGLQNLDFVTALKQLQQSNKRPDLNTHRQETVISADLVSRLLLQNQAVLDRLSTMDLPYSAVTEYPSVMQQQLHRDGTQQKKTYLHRFTSEPPLGVMPSCNHVRLKNVLDKMREEIDLATSQCGERNLELNAIRVKNRSLNEKLQTEQSKVSALEARLERSQQRNRAVQEEVNYLLSRSGNNFAAPSNAVNVRTDEVSSISSLCTSPDDFCLQLKHADIDGAIPLVRNYDVEAAARKCNISPIKEGYSSVKYAPLNHLTPQKNFTPEKSLNGSDLQMQKQQQSPVPLSQWDTIDHHSKTAVPVLIQQHAPAYETSSNTYGKFGVAGMSTFNSTPVDLINNSSRPKDMHAFIMSSFQQQKVCIVWLL